MLKPADAHLLHALRRRKIREQKRLFLAEGVRIVEEVLAAGIDLRLAVTSPSLEDTIRGQRLAAALRERVRTERVADHELERLAATDTPQGVVLAAAIPDAPAGDLRERAVVLVLDAVQDPGNFGTLVRSADAFGVAAVLALDDTVDAWNPKSVRASAGSCLRVPILELDTADALAWLRARDFVVYGADSAGVPLESLAAAPRRALIVGNEGAGLRERTRAQVDALVAVPTPGPVESLNVAVAAGILLHLLTRES